MNIYQHPVVEVIKVMTEDILTVSVGAQESAFGQITDPNAYDWSL